MLDYIFSWAAVYYVLTTLYVLACFILITIVLMQKGKGAGFAGAFGVGPGSDAVFGPRGGKSVPQRITTVAAATFMILAFVISLIAGRVHKGAAPELVSPETVAPVSSQALDDLGLGSATGATAVTPPPATSTDAPVSGAAPAAEAPAPEAPAPAAEAVPAPAAEAAPAPAEAPATQ